MKDINAKQNKRLKEVDILKAEAFIFVVAQHTIGGYSNSKKLNLFDYSILKFLYVLAKPAVPIFLFISGILLFRAYEEKLNAVDFYKKKIKYIIIPYVIWSAINMYFMKNTDRFKDFIIQVIAGNGAYHLWYMGMIIRLYLIFPFIFFLAKKIHKSHIIARISIFIGIVVIYYNVNKYNNVISDYLGKIIFGKPTEVDQRIINISFVFWYLYFALGVYVGLNYEFIKEKLLKYKSMILLSFTVLLSYAYLNETNNFEFIRACSIAYNCFSILTFYVISVMLVKKIKFYRLMSFIGRYSFSAYMLHVIVFGYVAQYLIGIFHVKDYLLLGVLACIIVSIISPILIKILSFIPLSNYITGAEASKLELKNYKIEIKIWKKTKEGEKIIYKAGGYKFEG
jgi:peptidoglycan/LPS O-acetylase OafA/YrhL